MGFIAKSMVAYAQPLLDETDGSMAEMQKAMTVAQVCWNLALLPDMEREGELARLRPLFGMDEGEFEEFRRCVVLPMIRRHHEMFPHMPRIGSATHSREAQAPQAARGPRIRAEKYPGTGRNASCPCQSGKKYKRCCGQ